MERLNIFSEVKKGNFPANMLSMVKEKALLTKMLHKNPELRPEAEEILSQDWLQESQVSEVTTRKRLETLVSEDEALGVDLINEEILDN